MPDWPWATGWPSISTRVSIRAPRTTNEALGVELPRSSEMPGSSETRSVSLGGSCAAIEAAPMVATAETLVLSGLRRLAETRPMVCSELRPAVASATDPSVVVPATIARSAVSLLWKPPLTMTTV